VARGDIDIERGGYLGRLEGISKDIPSRFLGLKRGHKGEFYGESQCGVERVKLTEACVEFSWARRVVYVFSRSRYRSRRASISLERVSMSAMVMSSLVNYLNVGLKWLLCWWL
jgi:hypothetical protein